jgi:hypothetical protein
MSAKSNVSRDRALFTATPHSWEFSSWPSHVWPNNQKRGQWICRAYRRELVAAGALSRIGRNVIIIGAPYVRWIESHMDQVIDFKSNNPAIGVKRGTSAAVSP